MNIEHAIAALREAQETLEQTPCNSVVGEEGPTLLELMKLVEDTGSCYGDDSTSHDAQWVWRKIEYALAELEP